MVTRRQTERLSTQHLANQGASGIFGEIAKNHDLSVGQIAELVVRQLKIDFPGLTLRHRSKLSKSDVNAKLKKIDDYLGTTLFVPQAEIRPDGGLIEVLDDHGEWRVVLVTEAKYQGKDVDNIRHGIMVGKKKDQDLMSAGNAIERSHKNVREIANFMLGEQHFPYILFLEGTNFLTETIEVARPDGRSVTLRYDSGTLNRIDRLTAVNYAMPINTNLCQNRVVTSRGQAIMLQAASIYTQGKGEQWDAADMLGVMLEVANTSVRILASDLFKQLVPETSKESYDG